MSGTRKPRNMAEFAELLGITPGAASLALRGSDQVSPELRKRVMKAAEATGYVPRNYRRKNERETNENVRPAKPLLLLHGNETDDDPVALEAQNNAYLGGDMSLTCSQATGEKIDQQVVQIVKAARAKADAILRENEPKLHELAKYLLEKETISGEEFMRILKAEP